MYDTLIIGGGPAGLQAALTIGRMHRTALLVDSGQYRNDPAAHAHNFATHDGRSPGQIRALARADIAAYDTVELQSGTVSRVAASGSGFVAVVDGRQVEARTLILATGLRDTLPDIAGLEDVWGAEAAACPFCHGHELAGRRIALVGSGPHVPMMAAMLHPIGSEVLTFDDGDLTAVARVDGGLRLTTKGGEFEVGGLFVHPAIAQAAPFAEQLGLEILPSGCVRVDVLAQTSVPGVFAAGDLAHVAELPMPQATVLGAAAAGLSAAAGVVRVLAAAEVAQAE